MFAQKWWPLMQCASCKTAPFSATPTLHFISEKLRKSIFLKFLNILVYSWFTILIAEFRGTEARMIVPCSPLELSTGDGFNHIPTLIPRQECSLCMCCQLAIFGTIGARWVGARTQQNGGLHGVVPRFPSIPTTVSTSDHTWLTNSTLASDTLWTGLSKIDRSVQPFRTLPWPPIVRNVN